MVNKYDSYLSINKIYNNWLKQRTTLKYELNDDIILSIINIDGNTTIKKLSKYINPNIAYILEIAILEYSIISIIKFNIHYKFIYNLYRDKVDIIYKKLQSCTDNFIDQIYSEINNLKTLISSL